MNSNWTTNEEEAQQTHNKQGRNKEDTIKIPNKEMKGEGQTRDATAIAYHQMLYKPASPLRRWEESIVSAETCQ